jgi:CMP-N,N'-diacetyllegionaminic acid synthase
MSILAIIPARKGSVGIKNKNMRLLKGKKLIKYTIEEAKKSKKIDKIYVSSDSNEILNYSKKQKVSVIKRPKEISTSSSKTFEAVLHLTNYLKNKYNYIPKLVLVLQPTSPLRKHHHIDEAIDKLIKNKKADSLVSCIRVPHNFTPQKIMKLKNNFLDFSKNIKRRQQSDKYFARNGAAIYIFRYSNVKNNLYGKKVIPYFMDKISSFDIDDFEDLKIIKKLI